MNRQQDTLPSLNLTGVSLESDREGFQEIVNLPGMRVRREQWIHSQQEGFKKNQVLNQEQHGHIIKTKFHERTGLNPLDTTRSMDSSRSAPPTSPLGKPSHRSPRPFAVEGSPSRPIGGNPERLMKEAPRVPDYVVTEREVLRAYGYFQDTIRKEVGPLDATSEVDVQITHKVTLFYYVADHSMEVIEERVPNSGVLGGTLMSRKVCVDDITEEPLTPRSFLIGNSIHLLGRTIHIVDCDSRTKDFLFNQYDMESPLNPLPYPETPSSFSALDATGLLTPRPREEESSSQLSPHKKRMEYDMRFHKYEGVVLRFDCVLDEREGFFPHIAAKKYTLLFYMANQTVEVLVQPQRGLDVPNTLISRRILPKQWQDVKETQRDRVEESDIVTEKDLNIGEVVDVFGKPLLIVSCDPFTQRFFQEEFGIHLQPMESPVMGSEDQRFQARKNKPFTIPPTSSSQFLPTYDEVKEQEERKAARETDLSHEHTWKDLIRKGTIDEMQKIVVEVKKVQRNRLEPKQNLILTYYLSDFSFRLYAPPEKNSGVVGGSVMKRGRHQNIQPKEASAISSVEPRCYLPQDFLLGQTLTLPSHQQVQVSKVDGASLHFLESFPSLIPEVNPEQVINKFKQMAEEKGYSKQRLRTIIRENIDSKREEVNARDILSLFDEEGLFTSFSEHEKITFLRAFLINPSINMGSLSYLEEGGEEDIFNLNELYETLN